jgi:hypothetical protein
MTATPRPSSRRRCTSPTRSARRAFRHGARLGLDGARGLRAPVGPGAPVVLGPRQPQLPRRHAAHRTYTQIYTTLTRRLLMPLWAALCDEPGNPKQMERARIPVATLFRHALTWRLYDKALLIAVAYPILLPVLQWLVTGDAAMIGSFEFLPSRALLVASGGRSGLTGYLASRRRRAKTGVSQSASCLATGCRLVVDCFRRSRSRFRRLIRSRL